MSDKNNDAPSLQNMFAQVLRDIQTGINRLEQSVNQATAAQKESGSGFPPPSADGGFSQPQEAPAPAAPKAPVEPYTGQRFEYKVVYINFRGQISSEGEQVVIGRGERRSSFVRQYLDELGDQGWELNGVSPLGETENSYFIFKRPATGERRDTTATTRAGQRVQVEEVDEGNQVAQL